MQIPDLPHEIITGGLGAWSACQDSAQQHRIRTDGTTTQSAALNSCGAHDWRVDRGLQSVPKRDSIVLFGPRPDLVGWAATVNGRPSVELLIEVKHF